MRVHAAPVAIPLLRAGAASFTLRWRRRGLDHLAIGVSSREELESPQSVLRELGAETDGIRLDRAGDAAMITFRDPDNIQWEFFEEPPPAT